MRISGRYSITIKEPKDQLYLLRLRSGMIGALMIGALQSLNYYTSTVS